MRYNETACRSAASPSGSGTLATSSGCFRNLLARLDFLRRAWRSALARAMRAPPWALAAVAAIGLLAAVALALR